METVPQEPSRSRKRSLSLSSSSNDGNGSDTDSSHDYDYDYDHDHDQDHVDSHLNERDERHNPREIPTKYVRTDPDAVRSSTITSFTCSLPPLCSETPSSFLTSAALDSHYQTHHAHACSVNSCRKIFPDEHFLDLHLREFHDPIVAVQRENGKKTYACFSQACAKKFASPQKRKRHLIDGHKYPREFFFALPKYGMQDLFKRFGESASLIIPSKAKALPTQDEMQGAIKSDASHTKSALFMHGEDAKPPLTERPPPPKEEPADALVEKLEKLSFIPTSVRFGRGKGKQFTPKR